MDEIVYFELNNWSPGVHYPYEEPFKSWIGNDEDIWFIDRENWVKENKLCVVWQFVDMSVDICIAAPKEWVIKNCPKLLTEYNSFIREPDEDGTVCSRFGKIFLPYNEENIGVTYLEEIDP